MLTLQDAADFIAALPQEERARADWHVASEALAMAAERDSEVGLAWAAVLRALGTPPPPEPPSLKPPKLRIVR